MLHDCLDRCTHVRHELSSWTLIISPLSNCASPCKTVMLLWYQYVQDVEAGKLSEKIWSSRSVHPRLPPSYLSSSLPPPSLSLFLLFIWSSSLPSFCPFSFVLFPLLSFVSFHPLTPLPPPLSFSSPFFVCRSEIHVIREKIAIEASALALQSSFATIATLISIATMVMRGHVLTAQDAFTIYTLMSVTRHSALRDLAYAVRYWADSSVTLERVQNLLLDFLEDNQSGMLASKKGLCTWSGNEFIQLVMLSISSSNFTFLPSFLLHSFLLYFIPFFRHSLLLSLSFLGWILLSFFP